jgi:hypothetical protein
VHHPQSGRHSALDSSAKIDVHTTNMLGASRGGIAGFAGSWIPGEVLPLQSPIQSTSLRGHNREVEETPIVLWWKAGHGCSTSSLMDPSALEIFYVERSFVSAAQLLGRTHHRHLINLLIQSLGFPSAPTKFFRHLIPVRFLPSPLLGSPHFLFKLVSWQPNHDSTGNPFPTSTES